MTIKASEPGKGKFMRDINIMDYDYDLPADRIAQYPVSERDSSKLLVYKDKKISMDVFRNIDSWLQSHSLLVFNNTRVINARLIFRKESGARIEILCLEPLAPSEYSLSFGSGEPVIWKCIAGNVKKWKRGRLEMPFVLKGNRHILSAERLDQAGDTFTIRFSWDSRDIVFAEIIKAAGHLPLPPYINREDEDEDSVRYQTVYSRIDGSVAAPTAGLHFTEEVLDKLGQGGIKRTEVTLHVGAGTFQPVKSENIYEHEMHCERYAIGKDTLESLLESSGRTIAVGTTSVRTIESIYWSGVKLLTGIDEDKVFDLKQWEAYELPGNISPKDSLQALLEYMAQRKTASFLASTGIMIVPGYEFRLTNGMITNFHQPRSTLLLLISAWTGSKWKELYDFASQNNFRFLSYGDSSLLL